MIFTVYCRKDLVEAANEECASLYSIAIVKHRGLFGYKTIKFNAELGKMQNN
jgi:hypothetical protein